MPVITGCPLVGAPGPPAFGRLFRWVFGLLFPPGPLGDWSEEFGVSAFPSSFNWLQYTHEHYASGLEKVHPQRKANDTTAHSTCELFGIPLHWILTAWSYDKTPCSLADGKICCPHLQGRWRQQILQNCWHLSTKL